MKGQRVSPRCSLFCVMAMLALAMHALPVGVLSGKFCVIQLQHLPVWFVQLQFGVHFLCILPRWVLL